MPITPPGSLLTFSYGMDDFTLAVESVIIYALSEDLTRQEFTNALQRQVKEVDGSEASFEHTAKNKPFQIFNGCGPETPRPTITDDDNLEDIFQRFDVVKLELKGTDSLPDDVEGVGEIARTHQALWANFQAHRNYIRSDISIDKLTTLQTENFSYLTSTNVGLSGTPFASGFSDILITNFAAEPSIVSANNYPATSYTRYFIWTAEVKTLAITYAANPSWVGQ